jgi:hypothetical protein
VFVALPAARTAAKVERADLVITQVYPKELPGGVRPFVAVNHDDKAPTSRRRGRPCSSRP